jgi:cytochrome P450
MGAIRIRINPMDARPAPPSPPAGATPRRLRGIDELPGPRGWPIIGNLAQVRMAHIHQDIERWCPRYGPVFRVRLGPTRMLVVADHEIINTLLRDRPDGFQRSSRLREIGMEMGGTPGLFSAEGDAWRHQRRMVMASFAPGHIRAFLPLLQKVTQRLQWRWRQAARAGLAIDLQADLKRFTVDAIAGLAFGTEVNTLDSGDDVIQRHLDIVLAGLYRRVMSPLPYWRWVRLPADRQLERSNAAVREAINGFIAAARQRMQADPSLREQPRNLLEAMLAAADTDDAKVDDRDVAGNVSTMLFAGEDTTANTLAWLIWLLHRHPDALRRAQTEVRDAVPDIATSTLECIDALDYLDACASEAMRLKPVAPFLAIEALRDTTVADIHVPAGTLVWCVMRHDSVDDRCFPRAAAFEPERWLTDTGATTAGASAKRVAMPFGSGPRICPGRYLALLEIKLAMAMLLGSFEIDAVDTPDGGDAREVMQFTMNPVGLRMRLREQPP